MNYIKHNNTENKKGRKKSGFTLIEVMVSVSIFAIVMFIATGAIFSIVEANKKAHSLKSVMTNLSFALESMTRDMRVGTAYKCNGGGDCPNGESEFSYKPNHTGPLVRVTYRLNEKRLTKQFTNGNEYPVTAEEIEIDSLKFYVTGTKEGDGLQPKVVISIHGYAGVGKTKSDFTIQTTITQRSIDS